ncbi:GHKL domain-containing protein [uncultured Eubacterium sp.]|uniref:GHKL domain-containing protein n=1 Tax=uncultured Eubacterium sp. TaxID=165185 RepID=UPI0025E2CA46|nr:GHKL domain-containing protein [uncultured Eubacterium sp.]
MTSLFCNLLDNALEAARYIPDSFIELAIHRQAQTAFTIITLVNSCRNNPFSGTGKQLKTTKENKALHGHGLKIIERVVNRYQGNMDYYYSEENHEFHVIILLKNPLM